MTGEPHNSIKRSALGHIVLAIMAIAVAIAFVSFFPIRHTESPSFATPAFQSAWVSEASAATRSVDLWGSEPLAWRVEPYFGARNDRRVVQYFERGRMESESGSSEVTLGKLAEELTTGEIDLGIGTSLERQPPEISIDSGEVVEDVPTYLTLNRFVHQSAEDRSRSGERVTDWVNNGGLVKRSSTPELRRFAGYVEETGHNLPDVTVELFQRPEFQGGRWVDSFGYPITEPFWAEYRRKDGMLPSLIQVFERRILVYTPGMDEGNAFTIASSGRHYSLWRYGTEPHPTDLAPPESAIDPGLTLADDLSAWVYADEVGTPIDLELSSTGHLMILTAEGQILKAESLDPDGNPTDIVVWAEGIDEPQGMVARGDGMLVTADNRIWWYHDRDGRGERSDVEVLLADDATLDPGTLIRGKPVRNSAGEVFARTGFDGSDNLLAALASDEPLIELEKLVGDPGPVEFADGDLLLTGRNDEDRTAIMMVPSVSRSERPADPVSIATFPSDTVIWSLAVANEAIWDIHSLGDVLVAVQDDDDASLFAVSRHQGIEKMEITELAGGLNRPTAIQVGLDGSIYVADADNGRIIRIRYTG